MEGESESVSEAEAREARVTGGAAAAAAGEDQITELLLGLGHGPLPPGPLQEQIRKGSSQQTHVSHMSHVMISASIIHEKTTVLTLMSADVWQNGP